MNICIDPGHSGPIEPGAVGKLGTWEANVTLAVGLLVRQLLSDQHQVTLTREGEVGDDLLSWRGRMAVGCDVFISLHCNAAGAQEAHGSEAWIIDNASEQSQALAVQVCAGLASITGEDRGVKRRGFTVISVAESLGAPAVLAEMEFISNPDGELSLINRQMDYAQAVAGAIVRYGTEAGL